MKDVEAEVLHDDVQPTDEDIGLYGRFAQSVARIREADVYMRNNPVKTSNGIYWHKFNNGAYAAIGEDGVFCVGDRSCAT